MGSQRVLSEFQEFLLSHATEAEKSTLSCEGLPSAGRLPPLRDPRSKKLLRPLHIFSPQSPQKTRHNPTDISVVKTGVLVNSKEAISDQLTANTCKKAKQMAKRIGQGAKRYSQRGRGKTRREAFLASANAFFLLTAQA